MPKGTVAMMIRADTKLSNCAASTSRTTTSAKPNTMASPLLVSFSVAASASGMMRLSSGSRSAASRCTSARAWPRGRLGVSVAVRSTARNCSSRPRLGATARSSSVTKVEIGIICPPPDAPLPARTNTRSRSPGSFTGSAVETR